MRKNGYPILNLFIAAAAALVLDWHGPKAAADGIPPMNAMSYSGTITQNGTPVSGPQQLDVAFFSDAACAMQVCSTPPGNMVTADASGHFTVPLPDACTQQVAANNTLRMKVTVGGDSTGCQPLGAVPYAVEGAHASNATNATHAGLADNAGHATSADSANNAGHASSADNATNAGVSGVTTHVSTGSLAHDYGASNCTVPAGQGLDCVSAGCPGGWIVIGGTCSGDPSLHLYEARIEISANRYRCGWQNSTAQGRGGYVSALCLAVQ